ncbi:MAG TPA: hypothetical protein VMI56_23795 [Reyranella sp.]|nr:hypothetical protein [Reyranella sp.]
MGPAAARDFDRLVGGLSLPSGASADLARLFSEPVPSRDRNSTDWYGPGDKIYTALTSLPEEQRTEVLARVDESLAALQGESERLKGAGDPQGELLASAITVPSPRADYIYVARDKADPARWYPVLVGWGHANDAPSRAGALPKAMVRERPAELPPAFVREAVAPVFASAPAMVLTDQRRSRWWLLLWLALTLLLLLIAWMLLRACGMGLPGYGIFHHIGEAFCPGTAVAATTGDLDRSRELGNELRRLQLEILKKQIACANETRQAEASRPPGNQPSSAPGSDRSGSGPSASDIDRRLKEAKAATGDFQISLAWDGNADLDLRVFCPDGEEISYSRRSGCGGTLDIDMNGPKNQSTTPVENVFWPEGQVPKGKFRIAVVLYERKGDTRPTIPFQIRIKDGANVRTVSGSVSQERKLVDVTEVVR